jgi:benzoate transport
MTNTDPRSIINNQPMGGFQIVAVLICVALNALDGFDVLAITFAGPGISKEWALGPGALGIVISTGLVGMGLGSLLVAPIADNIGRRPMILLCLAVMATGMFLSATAHNVYALAVWRVATGLGIGGMLASINAMVAEYANDQRRDLCVSLNTIGYPIGGVLGGMAAAWLLAHYDWRAVFIFGGVVSAIFLPVVWLRLPESIEFLAMKRAPDALPRINAILKRMGHQAADVLNTTTQTQGNLLDIFKGGLLPRTVIVCSAYFLHIMTFYYALGWIPSIVASLGYPPAVGAAVSVWTNLGGIIGGTVLGYFARRFGLKPLTVFVMLATAGMLVIFGRTSPDLNSLKAVAFTFGFFLFGAMVGLYATLARVYPTHVRATGTGFAIGLGRVGGMLGPAIGGWLMTIGMSRPNITATMALGSFLAALVMLLLPASIIAVKRKDAVAE